MTRRFLFACLVSMLCLGSLAWADKPKVAILGLEVIPGPSGAVDPTVTQLAKDLTTDLRQRVQSGASPYALAQNSIKELTDQKLLMSCDNEAASCMAVIGAGLAADYLLYGNVERRGDVYRVSVRLLDVQTKRFQTTGEDMAITTSVATMSKRLYAKLFGEPTVVAVRPPSSVEAVVEQPAPPARHAAAWKWSLGAGIGLAIAGSGFAYYSYNKMENSGVKYTPADGVPLSQARRVDGSDCGRSPEQITASKGSVVTNQDAFERACTWKTRIYVGYAVGAAGALAAVASLIMLTRDVQPAESPASGARAKKSGVAIAPILGPDAAGATLQVHW